jgi:Zn-dependent alcohol dehydrogenase
MDITAAVLEQLDGPFRFATIEVDDPRGSEVLVRLEASGVCRTDALARRGDLPFPLPGVLGHEGAGVVEAVGDEVVGFSPGDRVVIGQPACGVCRTCRAGLPRHCERLPELRTGGTRLTGGSALHRPGGADLAGHFFGQSSFATHALTCAAALVPVPDDLPLPAAATLTCDIAAAAGAVLEVARPLAGTRLAVFGAGVTGLAAIMAARNTAATRVVAVDTDETRLRLALTLGATHVVDASRDDPREAVADICGGPVDFTVQCGGDAEAIRQAADCAGPLGTCLLVGEAPAGTDLRLNHEAARAGRRLVGVPDGAEPSLISGLLELYEMGRFPIDRLIDYHDFTDLDTALDSCLTGDPRKPVVRMR